MKPKKTVLITGGAGYIGSHIAQLLHNNGYTIVIVDDLRQEQIILPRIGTFIKGNFGDQLLLEHIFSTTNIDTIIHCAASIDLADSVRNPFACYANNVSNTISLLHTMQKYDIRSIIFSSSCAVYGTPIIIPMHEDHTLRPLSPYGYSKVMCEQLLADAATAFGLQAIIFRYFNVAGAMPEFGLGEWHIPEIHLIPRLIKAAYTHEPFTIYGTDYNTPDGTCIRDFIHVWDIAQAHHVALKALQNGVTGTFNIGSGIGHSVRQIITNIEHITKQPIQINHAPPRPGDASLLISDISRARNVLNWQPEYSDLPFIIRSAISSAHRLWDLQQLQLIPA